MSEQQQLNNSEIIEDQVKKLDISDEEMSELIEQSRTLKRTLKQLSKNQLIVLVMQQVNLVIEQKNINKVLLEKLNITQKEENTNV